MKKHQKREINRSNHISKFTNPTINENELDETLNKEFRRTFVSMFKELKEDTKSWVNSKIQKQINELNKEVGTGSKNKIQKRYKF